MALGFGKKKGEDAGQPGGAPSPAAGNDSSVFDGDTMAFGSEDFEGDTFAFDADPDSLEQFANELEGGTPDPAPAAGASWDDDSLLGDLDEPAPAANPSRGHGQPESNLFDDLAMELEGIPGLTVDHQGAPAPAAAPERRTRRKPVSPDITAPGSGVKSLKAPKEPRAKGKLPLVPIVGGVLLLAAVAGGGYFMMNKGGSDEVASDETTAPAPPPRKHPKPPIPPANAIKPLPGVPGTAPGVKPGVVPGIAPVKPAAPAGGEVLDDRMRQLRKLWEQGRDAKHNKDKGAARKFWEEGLKLDPENKGFKESLAKLDEDQ